MVGVARTKPLSGRGRRNLCDAVVFQPMNRPPLPVPEALLLKNWADRAANAEKLGAACGVLRSARLTANESSMTDLHLTQLGRLAAGFDSPDQAVLERVPNPSRGKTYVVRFTCPEFTSLCPITGQPDFAHIVIDIIPCDWIVESKSLKLYLTSFRNHGAFHEACTMGIAERLVALLDPLWLRIGGYWYPRGGIPIDVFWQTGAPPDGAWIPPQDVPPYRGRG